MSFFLGAVILILNLVVACHVLLTKHDPRSALGWSAFVFFIPGIGLIVYLIFGISRAQSRAEKIMRETARLEQGLPAPSVPANMTAFGRSEETCLAVLGHRLMGIHLSPGNRITPLQNGDVAYPAMLAAIDKAKEHVFLSTYIFNYGIAAQAFIDALERAHKRGVDVRVLVDGIGAQYSPRKKPLQILKDMGIRTTLFRPVKLFPPNFGINLRSHRKVLVCDSIGFTGGMNIADGNLVLQNTGKSHIQDMHFQCEGPIVAELRRAFLINWGFCTGQTDLPPKMQTEERGDCFCRVIVDGPGRDGDMLNDIICGAINLSRQTVRIMSPYFLPTHEVMAAIRAAALRGVDVRIILPGKNNLFYVKWATERLLGTLLASGVRVWYQSPPFAHTKIMTVDEYYSLVGSANMDTRSIRLNFELNMEIFNDGLSAELSHIMDMTIAEGTEITQDYLNKIIWPKKLLNSLCWVFSPYL